MSAPDDDTLRAMLAARTPGEWAPYCDEGPIRYRYLAPDGDGWTYSVCVGGHDDDHTCVLTATGPDVATARANAALAATAPALAAEVLRLRAERDDLQAQVLRHHIMRNRLRSCVSDTNVTRAWDRMRSLILQDVEADGVSGEGADRHRK